MVDRVSRGWRARLRAVERWLLPHYCLLCTGPGESSRDLCDGCASDLPWNDHPCRRCANPLVASAPSGSLCGRCQRGDIPAGFDRLHAPLLYDFPVDRLVLGLKFHGTLSHGRLLGELMAGWLATTDIDLPDRLVPVPLHSKRRRQRGFNQARELARPIRSVLDVPIADGLVARAAAAPPQAELPLDRRRQNIRHQFQCRHRPPPHVAIIDDVVTSASTVAELARCLKRAGAERVDVYAVARTP